MTQERLPLAELLAKAGDGDFLRSVAETVLQLVMEADGEGLIGAGRHSPDRRGPARSQRCVAAPATLHADRTDGRTHAGAVRHHHTADHHRRGMFHGHLSNTQFSTTLMDTT